MSSLTRAGARQTAQRPGRAGVLRRLMIAALAGLLLAPMLSVSPAGAAVPDAPTNVTGVGGDGRVTVSWDAPANDGGSAITGYQVTAIPKPNPFLGGKLGADPAAAVPPFVCETNNGVPIPATTSTQTTCTINGLTTGSPYAFTVAAINADGTGPASAESAWIYPVRVPTAPLNVTAVAGNTQASVSWTANWDGGSEILGYTVTASPGGQTCSTVGTADLDCDVTGLTNGTAYTFDVFATNAEGAGDTGTSNSVTPATLPGAATGVTGAAGNGQATVSWSAPASDGGLAITVYTVTATPGGATCVTAGALSCIVPGLTNGTAYTFSVVATNGLGQGPASAPSAPVSPAAIPNAPTAVSATAGNAQATVSWTAPASNGGSAITGYKVTAAPGGAMCTTTGALSCVVSGLTNGTGYTFTVVATNAAGDSAASAASASVTPEDPDAGGGTVGLVRSKEDIGVDCSSGGLTHNFGDVEARHNDAVACLVALGVTTGTSDTAFSPNLDITREQIITMIGRFFEAVTGIPCTGDHPFNDVTAGGFSEKWIGCMFEREITSGTSGTTFSPGLTTPRDQMGTLIVRLYEQLTGTSCTGTHPFTDVAATSFAFGPLGCLYELGLTTGTGPTTYSPGDPVTRLQTALFLTRLYNLLTTPA